jgi:hypothetical protein
MSVTASSLSKSGARGKDLSGVIRNQLDIIYDKCKRHERTWGKNVVSHDLPCNFVMPGLAKKDAQRIVYSAIIRDLKEKEFEVALVLSDLPEKATIYVSWVTDLKVDEIEAMNKIIRAHLMPKGGQKLQNFLAPAGAGAGRAEPKPEAPRGRGRPPTGHAVPPWALNGSVPPPIPSKTLGDEKKT